MRATLAPHLHSAPRPSVIAQAARSPRHIFPDRTAPFPAPQTPAHGSDRSAWLFPARLAPAPSCVVLGRARLARTTRPDARAPAALLRPHTFLPLLSCPRLMLAILS